MLTLSWFITPTGEAIFAVGVNYRLKVAAFNPARPGCICPDGDNLERAAAAMLARAAWRLRDVRAALQEPANVVQVDFLETHPFIRSLDHYRVPFPS